IFSPGELSQVGGAAATGGVTSHAELGTRCAACHAPVWSTDRMGDRCLACHANVRQEIDSQDGLHGGFATAANCRNCHTDHRGVAASLTLSEPLGYPHERTGYMLQAHPTGSLGGVFTCQDCHPDSLRNFSETTCLACHRLLDLPWMTQHQATFGTACLNCHDGIDTYGAHFAHTTYPLVGQHAQIECIYCHRQATTLVSLRSTPAECRDCHAADDIHLGRLGTACSECHTPEGWQGASIDHSRTRFALTGQHRTVACESCHVDRQWTGIGMTCQACHRGDDPHGGQFTQDCSECHTTSGWGDLIFSHAQTGFPLEAAHAKPACADCHPGGRYVGTPASCSGCHAKDDRHNGSFGMNCGACHRPTTWSDWTFDHNLASFRLTGAHRNVACLDCHEGGRFEGTPSSCSACHNKPSSHGSAFGSNCGACHSTSAWRPASFNGPHPFPMNHGGAGGNCGKCHTSSLMDYSCTGCHAHEPARMEEKHKEVSGFSLSKCLKCHPGGKGGGD
ncbi:MAG TPA: cytochrome c3 family protein, partial [Anaerolineales bacterium]|nr:cytochrome c3 family protein [Anaerolineales bacterium]